MAFIAGLIAWFVVANVLMITMGMMEWGPWIGMAVGIAVYGYIGERKKKLSEATKDDGN